MMEIFSKLEKEAGYSQWAMANIAPRKTGLKDMIWTHPKTGREKHGPRIKAYPNGIKYSDKDSVSITVSDKPRFVYGTGKSKYKDGDSYAKSHLKDPQAILDLVVKFKEVFLEHWDHYIDDAALIDSLYNWNEGEIPSNWKEIVMAGS